MNAQTNAASASQPALLAALGAVALGLTLAFTRLPAVSAAGACWSSDHIFLFEFAASQADLTRIFGASGSQCRALSVAAMDAANTLDALAYIPAYTLFMCLAALHLARHTSRLRRAALALAFVAAAADYVETLQLLSLTDQLDTASGAQMLTARSAAWIKFGCLAAQAAVLSAACFTGPRRRPVLGVLLLGPALGLLLTAVHFEWYSLLKVGFSIGWLPLIVVGARDAFRRSVRSPAPAA